MPALRQHTSGRKSHDTGTYNSDAHRLTLVTGIRESPEFVRDLGCCEDDWVADVFVRAARLSDVPKITVIQERCWRSAPGMPVDAPPPASSESVRAWERAVLAPPSPRHQVFVALDATEPVGLSAVAPTTDPDLDPTTASELLVFAVDPKHRRHGHGSRLLTATMESLTTSGVITATVWVNAVDDQSRQFLVSAGWAADGAHRSLALDDESPVETQLRQVRMGTDLSNTDRADSDLVVNPRG